uniref:Pectinesterase inhibitor domain-containing protein n=1 Tax=Kalanchoe fedtschenkoi TaxID=63787 RepID=A0A7N0TGM3_KALFE
MSPLLKLSSALTALLLLHVCTSAHFSLAISDQQIQQICACTNANITNGCIQFLTDADGFKSAPDVKKLAPLVIGILSDTVNETSNYTNYLKKGKSDKGDDKLGKLYIGCAELYDRASAEVHVALEAAKAGNVAVAKDQLEESREDVHDCLIGARELNVTDASYLPARNEIVEALLDIATCVIKFAS